MMKMLLLVHVAATLCLVGLIWTIQVVHYPLMGQVGAEAFSRYHVLHSSAISWLVVPLMLVELGTAIVWVVRPLSDTTWPAWLGLALIGVIWLSTAVLQVPQHNILAGGFDAAAHHFLVTSNWLRTVAWSLRGVLVVWFVSRLMGH